MVVSSNFLFSMIALLAVEGGLTDDPADPGGLTYAGISYVYHPEWEGWRTIKAEMRRGGAYRRRVAADTKLAESVERFYRVYVWDKIDIDQIPDSRVQTKVFGLAVHLGNTHAIRALQGAVGQRPDGIIGPRTLGELTNDLANGYSSVILSNLDAYQRRVYARQIAASSKKQRYAVGWENRVQKGL